MFETYDAILSGGSQAAAIYERTTISERHRHRYEVSPVHHAALRQGGLVLSGTSPDGQLIEMVELASHPYFIACQFHPEFKSRPLTPHGRPIELRSDDFPSP